MSQTFIHLRNHSAYSLSEGAIHMKKLVALAEEHAMPAIALTDTSNLFGALEFSQAATSAGVQPIIGYEMRFSFDEEQQDNLPKMVLLAKNDEGYANLLKLASLAFVADRTQHEAHNTLEQLKAHHEGLILLTGGTDGPLGMMVQHGQTKAAEAGLLQLQALFGDRLYIELHRHGRTEDELCETQFLGWANEHNIPLVATNNCLFPTKDMFEAQDCLMCISAGRYISETDRKRYTQQHYFKSADEMVRLFEDLPEAVMNTVVIAQRCSVMSEPCNPMLPHFPTEEGRTEEEEFAHVSREGLEMRLNTYVYPRKAREQGVDELSEKEKHAIAEEYHKRLDYEIGIISRMEFPGYFLIVSDFIRWSKEHDIPVGPGRGSGAGSLVAWSMQITDLDPLQFGLLFERFLNPERVSMPDFDVDFCQERRDEVISYVQKKYGFDHVAQIITFGKLQARAVVRDVGRVLQMSYGQVDRLCKLIPNNPANPVTLQEAIDLDPELKRAAKSDEQVEHLIRLALQLEGMYRHAGTHAAGVVIGSKALDEILPLYQDPRSSIPATQFSMKYSEMAGLVKFDFLGLKTLTLIQHAVELVNHGFSLESSSELLNGTNAVATKDARPTDSQLGVQEGGQKDEQGGNEKNSEGVSRAEPSAREATPHFKNKEVFEGGNGKFLDISKIPLDDKPTFAMLGKGDSTGVFQIESAGMRDSLRKMKPDTLEDLIALISLYRPGPMENIPTYIARKHGREKPDYLHPKLTDCLTETYGVIIYQEQVMEIAKVLAGYSLGDADLLRRAMGKKIQAEMDKQRELFMEGAKANQVDPKKAGEIFDLVAKFAGYGFNKSHAAAYALIGYQTGYLKANHPVEFITACMNIDIGDTDKLATFFQEARANKIVMLPPDINKSQSEFTVEELPPELQQEGYHTRGIRYGLGAIKGVGEAAMDEMTRQRKEAGGSFKHLTHFAENCDNKVMNKRQIEGLAKAGAFDLLHANRAQIVEGAGFLARHSQTIAEEKAAQQSNLFGMDEETQARELVLPEVTAWGTREKLEFEKSAVGFYLSAHPLDSYSELLRSLGVVRAINLEKEVSIGSSQTILMAGIPMSLNVRAGQRGRFAYLGLSDPTANLEIGVFRERIIDQNREVMEGNDPVIVQLEARRDEGGISLAANDVYLLEDYLQERLTALYLRANDATQVQAVDEYFTDIQPGKTVVLLQTKTANNHMVTTKLPASYRVDGYTIGRLSRKELLLNVVCR